MRKSKKGLDIRLLLPHIGCIPNFRKIGKSDLEKMRYKQTNKRTDGTEIIGPSGKIPGTKNRVRCTSGTDPWHTNTYIRDTKPIRLYVNFITISRSHRCALFILFFALFLSFFFFFFPVFPSFFLCHLCISMSKIGFIINMLSQK